MPDIQILESESLQVHLENFVNFSVFLLDSRGKAGLKAASTSLLESAVLAEAEPSHINREKEKEVREGKTKNSLFEILFSPFLSLHHSGDLT